MATATGTGDSSVYGMDEELQCAVGMPVEGGGGGGGGTPTTGLWFVPPNP